MRTMTGRAARRRTIVAAGHGRPEQQAQKPGDSAAGSNPRTYGATCPAPYRRGALDALDDALLDLGQLERDVLRCQRSAGFLAEHRVTSRLSAGGQRLACRERCRLVLEDRRYQRSLRIYGEGPSARQHFVEHGAERRDRSDRRRLLAQLLRCHSRQRADDQPCGGRGVGTAVGAGRAARDPARASAPARSRAASRPTSSA